MSHRAHTKSRIKVCNKSFFHLQDKKADSSVLSNGLIKSAKRSGQLSLCNRGLGTGKSSLFIAAPIQLFLIYSLVWKSIHIIPKPRHTGNYSFPE